MALDPDSARLAAFLTDGYPDLSGEVREAGEARRILARQPRPRSTVPAVGAVWDRTIPGPDGDRLPVRIYRPVGAPAGQLPVAVYLHGGGWVFGDLDSHDGVARRMCADARCLVVAVDYRRAPEHPFPAALRDARAAVEWIASHGAGIGADPGRVALTGDSAGANIAAGLTLALAEDNGPTPVFQLLLYPVADHDFGTGSYRDPALHVNLTPGHMRWYWDQYVPEGTDRDHPCASPLRGRLTALLPPALVVTAECDPLRDEGRHYAAALAEAGVATTHWEAAGTFHGFFRYPDQLPAAADLIARSHAVLGRALATG